MILGKSYNLTADRVIVNHFNHNIDATWQKLDYHYKLSDSTLIY
jgi:hypothetical protein